MKMIIIKINDIEYSVNTKISFSDHKKIVIALDDVNTNYKRFLSEFIYGKIIDEKDANFSVEYIEEHCDLQSFIEIFLDEDETLRNIYQQYSLDEDKYKAFLLAIYQKLNDEWSRIAEQLPKIETQVISVVSSFGKMLAKVAASSAIETIGKVLTQFYESIGELAIKVADIISKIEVPTISDEKKNELLISFRMWGSYGWTILPNAPAFYYEYSPENISVANRNAMNFCKKADIESLFENLLEMKVVKKSDLEEAIYDYKQGKYKSCALIMFSLIDAKLIRFQNADKQRKVGKGAVDFLAKKMKSDSDIEQIFHMLLCYENLIACLAKMFEHGNDFRKQPKVINRNFIDHGMMTRKVLKRDCIQLFLLYYNLIMSIDFISK